jgi:hypothetical protein
MRAEAASPGTLLRSQTVAEHVTSSWASNPVPCRPPRISQLRNRIWLRNMGFIPAPNEPLDALGVVIRVQTRHTMERAMSNINRPDDRSRDDLVGRDPLLNRDSPRTFSTPGSNSSWAWAAAVIIVILIGAYALYERGGWGTGGTTASPPATTAQHTTSPDPTSAPSASTPNPTPPTNTAPPSPSTAPNR